MPRACSKQSSERCRMQGAHANLSGSLGYMFLCTKNRQEIYLQTNLPTYLRRLASLTGLWNVHLFKYNYRYPPPPPPPPPSQNGKLPRSHQ